MIIKNTIIWSTKNFEINEKETNEKNKNKNNTKNKTWNLIFSFSEMLLVAIRNQKSFQLWCSFVSFVAFVFLVAFQRKLSKVKVY